MTRVATFAVQNLTLGQVLTTQQRSQDLQVQVSSGKVSRDYRGIAQDSRQLLTVESLRAQAQRFIGNINQVERRLQTMETSTAEAIDVASDLRSSLLTALSGTNGAHVALAGSAEEMLHQVASLLNVQQDGRYLFAGSLSDAAPIDLDALFDPERLLVDAASMAAATLGGNGITDLPGIVSVQVQSGNSGRAYQLQYDGASTFTMTDLTNRTSDVVNLSAPIGPGETRELEFILDGERVVVTVDDSIAAIADDSITYNPGASPGAIANIGVYTTSGTISHLGASTISLSGSDAADATLTLTSADGNFVASGVDLETLGVDRRVTLTNAVTGATITLEFDITTPVADTALVDPGARFQFNDFFANVAATAGAVNQAPLPGDPGYDPAAPSFYKGDDVKLTLRADDMMNVNYGVTAVEGGFEKLIRALWITREAAPPGGTLDKERLQEALTLAIEAIDEIPQTRSQIGLARKTIDQVKGRHENATLLAEQTISDIENTDVTKALTLLSQNTTQLEASYSTLGRLNSVSLLDYL